MARGIDHDKNRRAQAARKSRKIDRETTKALQRIATPARRPSFAPQQPTEEMLKAGAFAYSRFKDADPRPSMRIVLTAIWQAMRDASLPPKP